VKRVTIPKKMGNNFTLAGKSRGFGFVEFISKVDAQRAKEALQSTHLYGRHLVLEYAKDERASMESQLE
jgi:multiple RNA-binding domain-containing protein 1